MSCPLKVSGGYVEKVKERGRPVSKVTVEEQAVTVGMVRDDMNDQN